MVPARPFLIGSPGWVRSSAWTWLFSSTLSTFRDRGRVALARLAAGEPLAVSRQILCEYFAVMTRQQIWGKALTLADAAADAATFVQRFTVLEDGPDQFMELSRRCSFGGRQVRDAIMVATMMAHGQRRLLTFNKADFRRFTD